VHVLYKGIAPALTDLMGGHLQLAMTSPPSVMSQVQAGRLKALAVGSAKRSAFLPEIPTIAESGYAGYQADYWWGIAAPAKTPMEIVNRLAAELTKALQSAELKQRFGADDARAVDAVYRHRHRALAASRARGQRQGRIAAAPCYSPATAS
jgi:tripartite-type tricarboxylate transporter receptor subunit TctC